MKRIARNSLLIICLLPAMLSCSTQTKKSQSLRPVKTTRPLQTCAADNNITIPASINELRETRLSFRVGGPLIKLNDIVGNYVREGEVIAKIDPRDFNVALEATESKYKLAKAEYERYKNLYQEGSVSKSVFDQMETNYKLAKTDFETAKNAFVDSEIKAPFSGYINNVFVNNYEDVTPGMPIISLIDMSRFEVNGWISIEDAAAIGKETRFSCIVKQQDKEIRIRGELKEIGNKTSMSRQSLPITVTINSGENLNLKAGMTAYLEISKEESISGTAYRIPVSSLFCKDNKTWVWAVNPTSKKVMARPVTTGQITDSEFMEIIDGLQGDETIVTTGVNFLFEGQEVKILEKFSETNIGNKL
jgi:RND family efflux transporter MFP subunit